jgi:hypothetical protein
MKSGLPEFEFRPYIPRESSPLYARAQALKLARYVLLGVGVFSIIVNAVSYASIESRVDAQIKRSIDNMFPHAREWIDKEKLAKARDSTVRGARQLAIAGIGVGTLFIVLGMLVTVFPATITSVSLALYVGDSIAIAVFEPLLFFSYVGFLIRLFILMALLLATVLVFGYKRAQTKAARIAARKLTVDLFAPKPDKQGDASTLSS